MYILFVNNFSPKLIIVRIMTEIIKDVKEIAAALEVALSEPIFFKKILKI